VIDVDAKEQLDAVRRCILARASLVAAEIGALFIAKKNRASCHFSTASVSDELRRLAWQVEDYYENDGAELIDPALPEVRELWFFYANFIADHDRCVEEKVRTILDALFAGLRV